MQYPYENVLISNGRNHIVLDAKVSLIVNAINADVIVPFGDFGGPNVYYFQTMNNGLGNIIYTEFDRVTTLGLASYMVRFGAATTIRQIILEPFPRSQVDLQMLCLPHIEGGIEEKKPILPPAAIIPEITVH